MALSKVKGMNLVAGEPSAAGSSVFQSFNPAMNKENPAFFHEANQEEINLAAKKAEDAFYVYSKLSDKKRCKFLHDIASELYKSRRKAVSWYVAESGLTEERAEKELDRTLYQLKCYGDFLLNKSFKQTIFAVDEPKKKNLAKPSFNNTLIGIGPVVVFGSSNFPFAYSTAGGDTASALAAGCPVINKVHPMHPGTSEVVAKAINRAIKKNNLPKGVFSNLNLKNNLITKHLIMHPAIKAIGFTGSITGGKAIYQLAQQRAEPVPVFAEMGSVNPVIFSEKCLLKKGESWVTKLGNSITEAQGQYCTNPGIIFLPEGSTQIEFTKRLIAYVQQKRLGYYLGDSIKNLYETAVSNNLKIAGVKVLVNEFGKEPYQAAKTILQVSMDTFLSNPELHEEVFGVHTVIVTYKKPNELTTALAALKGQLTCTINLEKSDYKILKDIIDFAAFKAGRIIFNGVPTGVDVNPAMQHGGPFPSSSDSRFTAVGEKAVLRWMRPICFQNKPSWVY